MIAKAKKKIEDLIKSGWDLRTCFEQLRFNEKHHLGLGDIRLTMAQQEEICELVEIFYKKKNLNLKD